MSLPRLRRVKGSHYLPGHRQRSRRRLLRWLGFFGAGTGAGVTAALMAPVRVPRGEE